MMQAPARGPPPASLRSLRSLRAPPLERGSLPLSLAPSGALALLGSFFGGSCSPFSGASLVKSRQVALRPVGARQKICGRIKGILANPLGGFSAPSSLRSLGRRRLRRLLCPARALARFFPNLIISRPN